jgi:hypothetical protein
MASRRRKADDSDKPRSGLLKKILTFLCILFGGGGLGAGGWSLKDHPLLQQALGFARKQIDPNAPDLDSSSGLVTAVSDALQRRSFKQPGVYKVEVADLTLDPASFKKGHSLDLQVRILKYNPKEKPEPVWSTKQAGARTVEVAADPISVNWKNNSFEVAWTPGQQYIVEIWNTQPRQSVKLFSLTTATLDEFPLKSGSLAFTSTADGRREVDPASNLITLAASRVRNLDSDNEVDQLADAARKPESNPTRR